MYYLGFSNKFYICSSSVITPSGEMIGRASLTKYEDSTIALISSKMWSAYRDTQISSEEEDLDFLLLQFESGNIAMTSATKAFLVLVYAKESVLPGQLKLKLFSIKKVLTEKFSLLELP